MINVDKTKWVAVHRSSEESNVKKLKAENKNRSNHSTGPEIQVSGAWFHENTDQTVEVRTKLKKHEANFPLNMKNLMGWEKNLKTFSYK